MGGLIGGIGSAMGGKKAADAANNQAQAVRDAAQTAAQTARLGYDYLTTGRGAPAINSYINNAGSANNELMGLLDLGGNPDEASRAFNTFLGSTPYQFQTQQGMNAITGSNAARGMLDSGATLKALNNYGQNMGKTALNGYINNLLNLGTRGMDALKTVGSAGSQAGQAGASALMGGANNAAQLTMSGVADQNAGMQGLFGGIDSALGNAFGMQQGPTSSWSNFFGQMF